MARTALAWCLLHPGVARTGIAMGPIDEVATLDELATRSFADASEDRVPDDGR
jgi:hypothetical protein